MSVHAAHRVNRPSRSTGAYPPLAPRPPIDTNRAWSPSSLPRMSSRTHATASRTVAPALTTGGSGVNPLDQVLKR